MALLPRPVMMMIWSHPDCECFFDAVLDDGLVHQRQHLFGLRLGCVLRITRWSQHSSWDLVVACVPVSSCAAVSRIVADRRPLRRGGAAALYAFTALGRLHEPVAQCAELSELRGYDSGSDRTDTPSCRGTIRLGASCPLQ